LARRAVTSFKHNYAAFKRFAADKIPAARRLEANRLAQRPLYFHYPPCHTDATQSLIDTILLLQQNKGG